MARSTAPKQDFATRLSRQTLARLDTLVSQGRFRTRTAAIEASVDRLFEVEQRDPERLRRAYESVSGSLTLGIDRESWRRAEFDRLDWEYEKYASRTRRKE